jgi:hypothetical protein
MQNRSGVVLSLVLAVAAISFGAAACGGSPDDSNASNSVEQTSDKAATGDPGQGGEPAHAQPADPGTVPHVVMRTPKSLEPPPVGPRPE